MYVYTYMYMHINKSIDSMLDFYFLLFRNKSLKELSLSHVYTHTHMYMHTYHAIIFLIYGKKRQR